MLDFLSGAWLDFRIADYLFPDISLCGKKQSNYGLGFVFTGHLYCIKLSVWSLPPAMFILLGAGCCLWDVAHLIWGFLGISNIMCYKKIALPFFFF